MPNNNTTGGRTSTGSDAIAQAYGYISDSTIRYVPRAQVILGRGSEGLIDLDALDAARRDMGRPEEEEPTQDSRLQEADRVRQRLREEHNERMSALRNAQLEAAMSSDPWTTAASMGLNRSSEDSEHTVEVTYHRVRNRYRENPTDASEEVRGELIEAFCALLDGGFHV
jgi:hypothetical protein